MQVRATKFVSPIKSLHTRALAEKLGADAAARTDVKLALVDVLDEALQGRFYKMIIERANRDIPLCRCDGICAGRGHDLQLPDDLSLSSCHRLYREGGP